LTCKSKSASKSSSKQEEGCISHGTSATASATTSTLSFGQTLEEGEDVPFMGDMDMMTLMTTTLKPRVRSMFPEDEEDMMMMMPMMPVLLAPPCPLLSTSTDEVVTTPSASFSSKLDKALSVLSPNDSDSDDAVADDTADDTADDWGVFASYDDDDEEDYHGIKPKHNNVKSKASSRSSFTKHATNPCFQPRAHLPVFATAGAE